MITGSEISSCFVKIRKKLHSRSRARVGKSLEGVVVIPGLSATAKCSSYGATAGRFCCKSREETDRQDS